MLNVYIEHDNIFIAVAKVKPYYSRMAMSHCLL